MANELGKILLENQILLESGTNELEVLVFRVGVYRLGINVAKVREVLSAQQITELPQAHSSVQGCFQLRDSVVTCVSLHRHLDQPKPPEEECNLILAEFNLAQMAFQVDHVEQIHRVVWESVLPPPPIVSNSQSPIIGLTEIGDGLVLMLDLEKIAQDMSEGEMESQVVDQCEGVDRSKAKLVVVDDSPTVRRTLQQTLTNSGYMNVVCFEHGQQAWEWLAQQALVNGDWRQIADVVISDVEMPAMDGLHLTQNIKKHSLLAEIPVILYSSIATPDNQKKGLAVGADAQITKPELSRVVEVADSMLLKSSSASQNTPVAPISSPLATTVTGSVEVAS